MPANNAHAAMRSLEGAFAGSQDLPMSGPIAAAIAENTRRLFVDRGLTLRGEFSACDHLAIAGRVESNVALPVLDILESGSFKGSATVAEARIAGRYEGALVVAETLVVGSAAYISGSVQCGKLQLEHGGKIDGDLRVLADELKQAARPKADAALQSLALAAPSGTRADANEAAVKSADVPPAPGSVDTMLAAASAEADNALLAKAEESFRAALKANALDVAALSGLGHLARQRGDLAAALTYFQVIMAADVENISVRCVAIDILHALSRHEAAAALAQEVEALRSQYSLMNRDNASDDADAAPGFDEAEAMFKSVLDRHPQNLGALAGLGHLARRRGDRVTMLKYYTAALALEPTNVTLRLEVARALKEQGEVALAQQILETALTERRASQAAG